MRDMNDSQFPFFFQEPEEQLVNLVVIGEFVTVARVRPVGPAI